MKEELNAENKRLELSNEDLPEQVRYHDRLVAERVNSRLKEDFGARHIRMRGHTKIVCHLLFGILALTVDQLIRLVT